MPPIIDQDLCVRCGLCSEICPMSIFEKLEDRIDVKYPEECWHCRACAIDCPKSAITMRYPLSHLLLHYEINGEG